MVRPAKIMTKMLLAVRKNGHKTLLIFCHRIWALADVLLLLPFIIVILLVAGALIEKKKETIQEYVPEKCTNCCFKMYSLFQKYGIWFECGDWKKKIKFGEEENIYSRSREMEFHDDNSSDDSRPDSRSDSDKIDSDKTDFDKTHSHDSVP